MSVLITNRKSHTGFQLVPTSMTLNNRSRHNSPYFVFFFHEFDSFAGDYVTVVEDRPIMSAGYRLPVPFLHCWPKLMHPALQSLCDSCASCVTQFSVSLPYEYEI